MSNKKDSKKYVNTRQKRLCQLRIEMNMYLFEINSDYGALHKHDSEWEECKNKLWDKYCKLNREYQELINCKCK